MDINFIENLDRIEVIADFVEDGSRIADIGSDHCKVPILLCEKNKISFAQAVENKIGPYKRMCQEIIDSGFSSLIKPSLSDGISDLDASVDTLIIAGMGGKLIKKILNNNKEKLASIDTIIIDAHNDRDEISSFLADCNYELVDNVFFYDSNKPYDVMKWRKTNKKISYTKEQLEFGPLNMVNKPASWVFYWQKEINRITEILESNELPLSVKNEYSERIKLIQTIIN